jgi:hypothetical protein
VHTGTVPAALATPLVTSWHAALLGDEHRPSGRKASAVGSLNPDTTNASVKPVAGVPAIARSACSTPRTSSTAVRRLTVPAQL